MDVQVQVSQNALAFSVSQGHRCFLATNHLGVVG